MEFSGASFLFQDAITMVDSRLQVCRNGRQSFHDLRQRLFHIVDKMGEASARAQGLAGSITTGRRLEMSDNHLYILKDVETSCKILGFLKVGRKRLFVYDRHGQQWEMQPLCVLDFYVHESRQRMGCGRRLFDYMLKSENQCPQHLAVDRPSLKFSSFLAKHYGLRVEIPQVNNFVIFEGFFTNRPDGDFVKNRRNGGQPVDFVSVNGIQNSKQSNYNKHQHPNRPSSRHRLHQVPAGLPSSRQSPQQEHNNLKDLNLNPRSAHAMAATNNSPLNRNSPRVGYGDVELRSLSAESNSGKGLSLQNSMYSRHQPAASSSTPTTTTTTSTAAPSTATVLPMATNTAMQRPPSGSRNKTEREKTPPLLQRDGPPRDYTESFNMHQDYQGRGGHLKVPSDPRVGYVPPSATPSNAANGLPAVGEKRGMGGPLRGTPSVHNYYPSGYYTRPVFYTNGDTTWTVTRGLRSQNQANAHYSGHSRLW